MRAKPGSPRSGQALDKAPLNVGNAISAEELTEAVRELVTERTIIVFEEPSAPS